MATFYLREADAHEVNQEDLARHPGLEAMLPLVEDLRAATYSSLQRNRLLGWDEPIFFQMHISVLATLRTPLECLCPFFALGRAPRFACLPENSPQCGSDPYPCCCTYGKVERSHRS